MPATRDEIEFHLLEIALENDRDGSRVTEVLKPLMRTGDTLFNFEGNHYIAVVGTRLGSVRAARRLMTMAQERDLTLTIEMADEPLPLHLKRALDRVIGGWVKVYPRPERDVWKG